MPGWRVLLLAVACALSVANVYYAQPLLDAMGREFGLDEAAVGMVVTATQIGAAPWRCCWWCRWATCWTGGA